MCYNCGCGIIDDEMGKGKVASGGGSLTEDDFKHMSQEWGMDIEEAKKNTYETLKKQFVAKD